jgi:predicted DNA-binding transcriptional regulator AlpA
MSVQQEEDPYLYTEQVAEKIGVSTPDTVRLYLKRTRKRISDGLPVRPQDLPLPDVMVRRSPAWRESTINTWIANRPGRGRRPAE